MSNALHNLQSSQLGTNFDGKFILVADFGTDTPRTVAEACGQGFGKGAIAINTYSGTLGAGERIFINKGDTVTSDWAEFSTST